MIEFQLSDALALGSRFKRLSDVLYDMGDKLYQDAGMPFQARWFPLIYTLHRQGKVSITELAATMNQSHSAVSQISRKLMNKNLIADTVDPQDERRRLLHLTSRGQQLVAKLEPVWLDINAVMEELVQSTGVDLLSALNTLENELQRSSLSTRFQQRQRLRKRQAVEIIDYNHRYKDDFKKLNEEWLNKYFYVESIDSEVLGNPEKYILAPGGKIFFARLDGEIIGTCALIVSGDELELSKMAITEKYQNLGIGRRLLEHAIKQYSRMTNSGLFLETNSRLKPAIHLYERMGFVRQQQPRADSHYQRADVYMIYRPERA